METTAEIKRLQSCINDLISVLALPAIWSGSESSHILGTLLDVLVTMLRLDFAYARLTTANDGSPLEVVRVGDHRDSSIRRQQFVQALNHWLTNDHTAAPGAIPDPTGEGEISIASFSLGLQHEGSVLIAGCRRAQFPTEIERLLLRVAANQAGLGLQEARRSGEQKQIAAMLEQRVAERTERLTALNDELQRSKEYLAEAQRLSHTGSLAFNAREPVYWSEENFRIWGFNSEQGLPDRETLMQRIHPEDRDRVVESVKKAVSEKADYAVEFRIVLPGGTVKYIQGLGHPVFNASGEVVEIVGTQLDVTERKHAEEERERLRQAQAELAHINRVTTMGELTASLAHEVNQPIAAAVTDANTCLRWLVRDQPDLEEARQAASRTVKDAKRAAEIISQVRLLFKKGTPQRTLVDVNEIIQEMIVLLNNEATRYSISVRTELADIPQVMADRVQLQQVLMNLIVNSIDAMKEIDGTRELTIKSQTSQDGQLLISVSDTGLGLPPQQADQIFNAFFTTKPHGTGMGLRISRSIVESHGGRLWAAGNTQRGASFHVALPTHAEAA
jgi:PAS domain S-box-containing protein